MINMILVRSFIDGLPGALQEAAKLDGAILKYIFVVGQRKMTRNDKVNILDRIRSVVQGDRKHIHKRIQRHDQDDRKKQQKKIVEPCFM